MQERFGGRTQTAESGELPDLRVGAPCLFCGRFYWTGELLRHICCGMWDREHEMTTQTVNGRAKCMHCGQREE